LGSRLGSSVFVVLRFNVLFHCFFVVLDMFHFTCCCFTVFLCVFPVVGGRETGGEGPNPRVLYYILRGFPGFPSGRIVSDNGI